MKKMNMIFLLSYIILALSACDAYTSPDLTNYNNDTASVLNLYVNQYDNFGDKGQYWIPQQKTGTNYWIVTGANSNTNDYSDNSLRNHILSESIIGLTALAVNENRGNTMVWTDVDYSSYNDMRNKFGLTNNGSATTWELLTKDEIKKQIKGYVLCSVRKQESLSVAAIASHVYQSIIVDSQYEDSIQALGYTKTYDATNKSMQDGWTEFKDLCNNDALVLMPTLTGVLKSFAIAHRLMVVNYNKNYTSASSGNNKTLFTEILNWLEPISAVLGWEQNVSEDTFVDLVSKSGNLMVPADYLYNSTFASAGYTGRQSGLATVTNPKYINFNDSLYYTSFFLSDGDNVQWMMNNFNNSKYYLNVDNLGSKISFGLPVCNLSMLAPYQLSQLLSDQAPVNSIIEFGGGGYFYADGFAENKDRSTLLSSLAEKIANHMRQRRVKVLGLFSKNVTSENAKEAYQAFIESNNQLVGIIAVQYDPYAGGNGEIMWFTNSDGINIPVVTVRYSLWNFGSYNASNQGTPAYVSSLINNSIAGEDANKHSLVAVHAWSAFADTGTSGDLLAENTGGSSYGGTAALWCANRLNSKAKVVNVEELLWQIRMHYYPEQTNLLLNGFY